MIKILNESKLTVVHFERPNPMQICAYTWIYRWTKQTVENQDWATGPSGRRAAGPWRAVGRGPAFSKTPLVCMFYKVVHLQIFKIM